MLINQALGKVEFSRILYNYLYSEEKGVSYPSSLCVWVILLEALRVRPLPKAESIRVTCKGSSVVSYTRKRGNLPGSCVHRRGWSPVWNMAFGQAKPAPPLGCRPAQNSPLPSVTSPSWRCGLKLAWWSVPPDPASIQNGGRETLPLTDQLLLAAPYDEIGQVEVEQKDLKWFALIIELLDQTIPEASSSGPVSYRSQ